MGEKKRVQRQLGLWGGETRNWCLNSDDAAMQGALSVAGHQKCNGSLNFEAQILAVFERNRWLIIWRGRDRTHIHVRSTADRCDVMIRSDRMVNCWSIYLQCDSWMQMLASCCSRRVWPLTNAFPHTAFLHASHSISLSAHRSYLYRRITLVNFF